MKKIFLFSLMTFFVQTSFCQNLSDTVNVEYSKNSPKRWSIGFGIPPGTNIYFDLTPNLDNFLESQKINYKHFPYYFTIPLAYNFQQNRFKFEIAANYTINYSPNKGLGQNSYKLSGGYAILSERNYFIYLNLGIGFSEYYKSVNFKPSNQSNVSLASVIQSGVGETITLNNTNGFLDVNIESMMRTKKPYSVGRSIKVGYRYGLAESAWTSTSVKLVDGPSDRMNGFYLQGTLNINWQRRNREE